MGYSFNSEGHEEMQAGGVLPASWYGMQIDETAYEQTKSGDGHFIKLAWVVVDGPHAGRKYFARLNVDNPNRDAVEIAERELTSICRATGLTSFSDVAELQGLKALVRLGVKKRSDGRGDENQAYEYKPYTPLANSAPPRAAAPRAASRPRATATAKLEREYSTEDDLPF